MIVPIPLLFIIFSLSLYVLILFKYFAVKKERDAYKVFIMLIEESFKKRLGE